MRRILAFIAFLCFTLQQFTCCCGSLHGFEQFLAGSERDTQAPLDECCEHDHDHHGRPEDSHQTPCCPDGPHLCAVTHVFAVSESRVEFDHSLGLCVWGGGVISSSGEVALRYGRELQDLCDPSPLGPSLERLCTYLI